VYKLKLELNRYVLMALSRLPDSAKLNAMDKVEYTEAERWLIEPKPGTAAARARDFGVDLSLTVSNLRLTPEERVRQLDEFQAVMKEMRKAVITAKQNARHRAGTQTSR